MKPVWRCQGGVLVEVTMYEEDEEERNMRAKICGMAALVQFQCQWQHKPNVTDGQYPDFLENGRHFPKSAAGRNTMSPRSLQKWPSVHPRMMAILFNRGRLGCEPVTWILLSDCPAVWLSGYQVEPHGLNLKAVLPIPYQEGG